MHGRNVSAGQYTNWEGDNSHRHVGGASSQPLLSLVVVVHNEEDNLAAFRQRLDTALQALPGWRVEIIFVDDGSQDGSLALLRQMHEQDSRLKILRLSRNVGSWNAVVAGVHAASGDTVMWMSSDLQEPPELIPQLVRRWEEGADVVWAVRAERHDPWPRRLAAVLFYALIRHIGLPQYPPLGMDTCLMDRRVALLFGQLQEHNRFTQGLVMSLGFRQVMVPYVREKRQSGRSTWGNLPRLSKMGFDMIVGFSNYPLRLMLYLGLTTGLGSLVWGGTLLVKALTSGSSVDRSSLLMWIVLFFGAINFTMLGILGEYVWRILEQVRGRPLYVVQERIGFESPTRAPDSRQVVPR